MFHRLRSGFASVISIAAAAFGLGESRGPAIPAPSRTYDPVEPPRSTPASKPRAERNAPAKRRSSSSWTGAERTQHQEMARRRRQIERGILTISNGWVGGTVYFECDEGYAHPVGTSCGPMAHLHG